MIFSKAVLNLFKEKTTAEQWQPHIDDNNYMEFKIFDFLDEVMLLDTKIIYPGTDVMRPFGVGEKNYCQW